MIQTKAITISDTEDVKPTPMTSIPVPHDKTQSYVGNSLFGATVFVKDGQDNFQYYQAIKDVPEGIEVTNTEYWRPISTLTKVAIHQAIINTLISDKAFIDTLKATIIEANVLKAGPNPDAPGGFNALINENGDGHLCGGEIKFNQGSAEIGKWKIEDGRIVSKKGSYDKIILDAESNAIRGESNDSEDYNAFSLSPSGFFCNSAKKSCLPDFMGIDAKGAIVAYGYGNVRKDDFGNQAFLTGVYGRASNSNQNPAPTYGGYFQRLRANGLHVSVNRSTGGSISMDTTFTACDETNYDPTYSLPPNPYNGQMLFFTTYNRAVTMRGNGHSILFGGSIRNEVRITGACRMCVFIFDGTYWRYGRMEET